MQPNRYILKRYSDLTPSIKQKEPVRAAFIREEILSPGSLNFITRRNSELNSFELYYIWLMNRNGQHLFYCDDRIMTMRRQYKLNWQKFHSVAVQAGVDELISNKILHLDFIWFTNNTSRYITSRVSLTTIYSNKLLVEHVNSKINEKKVHYLMISCEYIQAQSKEFIPFHFISMFHFEFFPSLLCTQKEWNWKYYS